MAGKGRWDSFKKFQKLKQWPWNWGQGRFHINRDISAIWRDINTRFDNLESLRKDTHLKFLDHLTLTYRSRSNFHRKIWHFGFSHFNSDFSRNIYRALLPQLNNVDIMSNSSLQVITWPQKVGQRKINLWSGGIFHRIQQPNSAVEFGGKYPPFFLPNSTAEFQFIRAHHHYYVKAGYSFAYIALK